MYHNLNPGVIGLPALSIDERIELAKAFGFGGIDVPVETIDSVDAARDAGRRVADAGLRWGLFWLPRDFLRCDDEQFETGMDALQALLPKVEAAGCRRTYNHVFPGSNEREFDVNFEWHVTRLRRLCDVLGPAGVQLGIEFVGPKTKQDEFTHPFIRTPREAAKMIDAVDRSLGIVIDTFHWYSSGATLDELAEAIEGRDVVNVHVNDAAPDVSREEQLDFDRRLPLETGLVDAPAVLRLLNDRSYDGPVICEPFNPHRARFQTMPPREVLAEIADCMNTLFEEAGVTW